MERTTMNIAVIGAGVVGITVAKLLQDELRDTQVTVIADKFDDEVTSSVAAGIFRPGTSFKGPTETVTKKWIEDSYTYWRDMLKRPESIQLGVMPMGAYIFSKDNYHITKNHLIDNIVPVYREADDNELKICNGGWRYGSYFTTLKVECEKYLPYTKRIFTIYGGTIVREKINSFKSLTSKYDLVFNCTGLGAKTLCNDHDLVPMRGQVIKVKAPWLKTAFYGDYDTYIIPGTDGIATLGGVRQYDSYNLNVSKHDAAAIMERCSEMIPALGNAEVVAHRVGLRPHRTPVRVEAELVDGVKVVHCYGHGGYGVTCAPGTALYAVKIGLDFLRSNVKNKL